jgi:GH24 family phage-related lysozyme (muramidase)
MGPHGDVICPLDPRHPDGGGIRDPDDVNNPGWTPLSLPPADPIPGLGSCSGQNPLDVFREHARAREGYSLRVYADNLGNPTVGIGHLVVPADHLKIGDVITEERAMAFWEEDSRNAFNAALKQAKEAGICDPCFIAALAAVDYQLGVNWRSKFPIVWALIAAGRYEEAASMLETSAWMQQTPVRVRDFQMALRSLPPKPPSCLITSGVPGHPVDPAPSCSTIGWLSGAYQPGPGFEALRPNNPAKSNICTVFVTHATDWAGLTGASSFNTSRQWMANGCANLIVSFRTLPGSFSADSCTDNYRRIAEGEFDDYYIAMATNMKNAGVPANAVIRIGWELNSDFPWGLLGCRTAEGAQAYIAGHRHIVDLLRMYFGDQFTVSWNFLKEANKLALPIDSYYPGNEYVDNINVDYYDAWPGATSVAEFNAFANQGSVTSPQGINTWLAYAQSKGKKIGFDEWGIVPAERNGHGDNPAYIQAMYEWFQMHSCQVAYESYFNGHERGHALGGSEHPAASSMYASLWGRSETTELKPPCSCTPITTPPPPPPAGCIPTPPPPPPAQCTGTGPVVEVRNAAEFQSQLSRVAPGTTITLLPGDYGHLKVNRGGSSATQPIYIAAKYPAVDVSAHPLASPAQRSNVSNIVLTAGNVTMCGLFFDDKVRKNVFHDKRADNVMYLQNYFNTGTGDGFVVEIGLDTWEGGNNLTVQSNYFNATRNSTSALDYGIALYHYNGAYIRGNVFDGVYNHQVSLKERDENVVIDGNIFKGCGQQCLEIGQQPDVKGDADRTGGSATITNNVFMQAYTSHPQNHYTKALVLRNQENIVVRGNTFQARFNETILSNFINRGGLERLADRIFGVYQRKATSILIEGNTFTNGFFHFTGRGVGPKNGGGDTIQLRGNTGSFTCKIGPFEFAKGKLYDMPTIDESAPKVSGCPGGSSGSGPAPDVGLPAPASDTSCSPTDPDAGADHGDVDDGDSDDASCGGSWTEVVSPVSWTAQFNNASAACSSIAASTAIARLRACPDTGADFESAMLWSKQKFTGDVKVEYDYTLNGTPNVNGGNISALILMADPIGPINQWGAHTYVTAYSPSLAGLQMNYAYVNDPRGDNALRLRGLKSSAGNYEELGTGVITFTPGRTYHIVATKGCDRFTVTVDGTTILDEAASYIDSLGSGYVGFREMIARDATISNVSVSTK